MAIIRPIESPAVLVPIENSPKLDQPAFSGYTPTLPNQEKLSQMEGIISLMQKYSSIASEPDPEQKENRFKNLEELLNWLQT